MAEASINLWSRIPVSLKVFYWVVGPEAAFRFPRERKSNPNYMADSILAAYVESLGVCELVGPLRVGMECLGFPVSATKQFQSICVVDGSMII